jgi:hypothetical protein
VPVQQQPHLPQKRILHPQEFQSEYDSDVNSINIFATDEKHSMERNNGNRKTWTEK